MTDRKSTATAHLSVAMTTEQNGVTSITGEITTGPASSRGAEFYFGCAVIVIGIVGTT